MLASVERLSTATALWTTEQSLLILPDAALPPTWTPIALTERISRFESSPPAPLQATTRPASTTA